MKEQNLEIKEIGLDSIDVHYHPRKNLGDIEKLQGSIKRDGLQEPLLVFETSENRFAIIDGYRRFEAIKGFGWKTVSCLIKKDIGEADAAHLSYVKNAEREGFNSIEIAHHLKAMIDSFGFSLRDLELKGYGTPPSISNKIKLLNLPEKVQKMVHDGSLTAAHGLALLKMPKPKELERMAERIIDHGLNAKRSELQIDRYLSKGDKPAPEVKVAMPETDIPGVYIKDARDMSELSDKSVPLVVTSPPYYVGMEFEKGMTYAEHWVNVQAVMKECARVLVAGGIMAINVGDINNFKGVKGKNDFTQIQLVGHKYQGFLRKHQIYLTDMVIWVKSTAAYGREIFKAFSDKTPHTGYRMMISHDPVYIFRKKGERELPSEDVALRSRLSKAEWTEWASGIWEITRVKKKEDHPAVFPDELAYRLIRMFSYEGDTVLDPFLGSGTTIKVARELNREGIGYEREPQYKAVILDKLGIAPAAESAAPFSSMLEYSRESLPAEVFDEAESGQFAESENEEEVEMAVAAEVAESE